MSLPDCATPVRTDDVAAVKAGDISGQPIVDRNAGTTVRPPRTLQTLSPGDAIHIGGRETVVKSTRRPSDGPVYRLGLPVAFVGTISTLYVNRDPYLLSACNGAVAQVPREEVSTDE